MFDLRRAMDLGLEFRKEWLQQNFPCLCEHISIVIQLSFLGILLLHSLQKSMGQIFKQRTAFPDQGHREEWHWHWHPIQHHLQDQHSLLPFTDDNSFHSASAVAKWKCDLLQS
ncbi:hypothetical protein M0R45_035207 [Rubus argutus]|uniref:Uncharacterized protein n=1 Tax=Rubus argutus TaxID=59490 RepID=A0AAW1VW53_RUBAR